VLQAVSGGASALFIPASNGLMPMIVPARQLQQTNALRGIAQSAGMFAGPAVAGVLIATLGTGWAIATDAATFALSAAVLSRLQTPHAPVTGSGRHSLFADLKEGWREFRVRTWVWAGVTAAAMTNMLFAGYLVLGPAIARADLGGAAAWALISASFGAGMLVGGLAGLRVRPERPLRLVALLLSLIGAPSLALAAGAPTLLAAGWALPAGVALALLNAIWETTLQQQIPSRVLSRVTAYDWLGSLAFQPLGFGLAGVLASLAGLRPTLLCIGLLSIATGTALLAVHDVRAMTALAAPPEPTLST
jgi:MFS family permease